MTIVAWKPNGEKCPVTNVVDENGVVVGYHEYGTEKRRVTYKDGELARD
jgi:antitoxin component YwqK of YwqJK toxin-antitoxin module